MASRGRTSQWRRWYRSTPSQYSGLPTGLSVGPVGSEESDRSARGNSAQPVRWARRQTESRPRSAKETAASAGSPAADHSPAPAASPQGPRGSAKSAWRGDLDGFATRRGWADDGTDMTREVIMAVPTPSRSLQRDHVRVVIITDRPCHPPPCVLLVYSPDRLARKYAYQALLI